MRLFTYATHTEGMFLSLVRQARPVVLGFGAEWKGFYDKVTALQEAIRDLHDDEVVCFVDGFDTCFRAPVSELETRWRAMGAPDLLFSRHRPPFQIPLLSAYVTQRVFLGDINSGAYMGRARAVRWLLAEVQVVRDACRGDDQRAFNVVVRNLDAGVVDNDSTVFHTASCWEKADSDAVVVHMPCRTAKRVMRGVCEYGGWFVDELSTLAILLSTLAVLSA